MFSGIISPIGRKGTNTIMQKEITAITINKAV
jgi:hypothetical protein